VRRRLALLTLAATAFAVLAVSAVAAAKETVTVTPKHGDVNTRFVFHGTGWRPSAKLAYQYGPFCAASAACATVLLIHSFKSDAHGEFTQTLGPWERVPSDFVGTEFCFIYAPFGHCKAKRRVTLTPPSASVTPAHVTMFENGGPFTMTAAAEHFRAGERLTLHVRYPNGRHRTLTTRARRHGAYVGVAWAPRGGAVKLFDLHAGDPDGTYRVRVTDEHGGEARTSFVASHYAS
jgi:hypothetical protein